MRNVYSTILAVVQQGMTAQELRASLSNSEPPAGLSAPLQALWWDEKGDWKQAHGLVDELETADGMAVHAYLHRKEGAESNADYWYRRAGRQFHRPELAEEWTALVEGLGHR
jgi:hypothetical protein